MYGSGYTKLSPRRSRPPAVFLLANAHLGICHSLHPITSTNVRLTSIALSNHVSHNRIVPLSGTFNLIPTHGTNSHLHGSLTSFYWVCALRVDQCELGRYSTLPQLYLCVSSLRHLILRSSSLLFTTLSIAVVADLPLYSCANSSTSPYSTARIFRHSL